MGNASSGRDREMVFFLAFLVLTTIVLPMIRLSLVGRLALSLTFGAMLTLGAFATIRHHIVRYLVVALMISTLAVDLLVESGTPQPPRTLDTALKLACLSILVFMTLKRTLRPGAITGHRVIGGIVGYLLIGFTWAFAYQLLILQLPGAIRFDSGTADTRTGQENQLLYFSFVTLTTVGYGDVRPVHPVGRSLAVAEALVGQLYIAIMISSLVGMALNARSARMVEDPNESPARLPPGHGDVGQAFSLSKPSEARPVS
jgi:hypothetical protein